MFGCSYSSVFLIIQIVTLCHVCTKNFDKHMQVFVTKFQKHALIKLSSWNCWLSYCQLVFFISSLSFEFSQFHQSL